MSRFFYGLTFLGGLVGLVMLAGAFVVDSAPQQAALAAIAVGFAVIPYCMARALATLTVKEPD